MSLPNIGSLNVEDIAAASAKDTGYEIAKLDWKLSKVPGWQKRRDKLANPARQALIKERIQILVSALGEQGFVIMPSSTLWSSLYL